MATHDYIISNASGAAVRADLNNALAAIVTNNSSATAPTTTYAYQWWADTGSSPAVMKLRNAANSAWITLFQLDGEWSLIPFENGTAAAPSIYFKDSGTDTGIFSPGTDQVAISTGGLQRATVDASGRLLVGATTAYTIGPALTSDLQVETAAGASVSVFNNGANTSGAYLTLGKSRGTTVGSNTIVNTNDELGGIYFAGADGASRDQSGAAIIAAVDGTPGANDMPGRLLFATTADGASSPTTRATIDSSGRLLVGTTTARSIGDPLQAVIQLENTNYPGISIANNTNDTGSGSIRFGKSRGTVNGSNTIVNSGDNLGAIVFAGADGTDLETSAASISCAVDGTPGANDMPGRLVFSTTADGASSPTERMRITSGGELLVGGTNDNGAYNIQCNGTGIWAFGAYVNGSDERLKEDITPLAPTFELVKQLNPVSFRYKEEYTSDTAIQPGFIAQELQQILEDQPYIDGIVQAGPEFLSVAYQSLIPVLTKALQEAIAKIETLEAKVAALEAA